MDAEEERTMCAEEKKGGKDKVGGWNVGRQIFKSSSCFMEEE